MEDSIAHKTVKSTFWTSIEKIATMGISFIITMLLARLLSPKDYGIIAIIMVFIAISNSIIDSGFSTALIRKDKCDMKDYSTAFTFNFLVGLLLYTLLYLLSPIINSYYQMPLLDDVIKIYGLVLLIDSFKIVPNAILIRNLCFRQIAKISVFSVMLSGCIGIYCAYNGLGVWSLVIQVLLMSFTSVILLLYKTKWIPKFSISKSSFLYLWGFGSKMLVTGIISNIYANLYSLVIGKAYNSEVLGLYNRGEKNASLIPNIISSVFCRNILPILSQIKHDRKRMINAYRQFVVLVTLVSVPFTVLLVALAKPFVLFFLSDKWADSIIYLQIFSFASLTAAPGMINLIICQVDGRSDILLKAEIIKKTIGVILIFSLLPLGPIVLATGKAIYDFVIYGINLYFVKKLVGLTFVDQIRDISPIILSSIPAGAIAYLCTWIIPYEILQLIIGTFLGLIVFYIISNYLFKMNTYSLIFEYLKNNKL